MAQYKKKKTGTQTAKRPLVGIIIVWSVFVFIWLVIFLYFRGLAKADDMPSLELLENPRSVIVSEVWSEDGVLLGTIGIENRSMLTYREITNGGKNMNLINALIATEDVRFYEHAGIDARSLFRVFFKTVVGRHSSSGGGSTITQQLAKNLFKMREGKDDSQKSELVQTKLKEWIIAAKLEHNYSKEEILAMYLNTVDFGSNAFGIKSAANTFFDKEPDELSVEEAAVLVGLLKAPTTYSPVLNPKNSFERRNVVLSQMNNYIDPTTGKKFLSDAAYDSIKNIKTDMSRYNPVSHNDGLAPYLREYVRNYMKDWCSTHRKPNGEYYNVHTDGLRIYTTIDSRLQAHAEKAVEKHMKETIQPAFFKELAKRNGNPFNKLSKDQEDYFLTQAMKASDRYYQMKQSGMTENDIKKHFQKDKVKMTVFSWNGPVDTVMTPWDSLIYVKKFLNAGLISIENGTGHVKAYVGGINYRYFKYDNVMQSRRQVGSTFKPFVYTMALQDLGMNPYTMVPNTEVCIGNWCPRNSTHTNEGQMVTLKWALANSVNWVSAYLMKEGGAGGPSMVINIARKMGVTSPIDEVPAICVGAAEVTVLEMAGAMSTFPNNGEYVQPIFITRIEDNKGKVLESFTPERREAISPRIAWMMIQMMKGVIDSGTGARLRGKQFNLSYPMAGKTGTTQNNSDCWFVGITPKMTTVIWTGGELRSIHFRSMEYGQGARLALPIFGYYMRSVYDDTELNFYRGDFTKPNIPDEEFDEEGEIRYQEEISEPSEEATATTNIVW
ncbi:MAG: transglycosylase domain-containing protein [Bacteroidales bacterium]|nr:transglycosylase domain-containing protein [Bacteroidales bacterium]